MCDNSDGMAGRPEPTQDKQLESQAKNNFCTDASSPVPMHFDDFSRLNVNADRAFESDATPFLRSLTHFLRRHQSRGTDRCGAVRAKSENGTSGSSIRTHDKFSRLSFEVV